MKKIGKKRWIRPQCAEAARGTSTKHIRSFDSLTSPEIKTRPRVPSKSLQSCIRGAKIAENKRYSKGSDIHEKRKRFSTDQDDDDEIVILDDGSSVRSNSLVPQLRQFVTTTTGVSAYDSSEEEGGGTGEEERADLRAGSLLSLRSFKTDAVKFTATTPDRTGSLDTLRSFGTDALDFTEVLDAGEETAAGARPPPPGLKMPSSSSSSSFSSFPSPPPSSPSPRKASLLGEVEHSKVVEYDSSDSGGEEMMPRISQSKSSKTRRPSFRGRLFDSFTRRSTGSGSKTRRGSALIFYPDKHHHQRRRRQQDRELYGLDTNKSVLASSSPPHPSSSSSSSSSDGTGRRSSDGGGGERERMRHVATMRSKMLRVSKDDTGTVGIAIERDDMVITSANAHAQSMGLDCGQIVTHVNSVRVRTAAEYAREAEEKRTFTITIVSADPQRYDDVGRIQAFRAGRHGNTTQNLASHGRKLRTVQTFRVRRTFPQLSIRKSPSIMYNISRIEPTLFLGGRESAMNRDVLLQFKITHIVNATLKTECHFEDVVTYLHLDIPDSKDFDISKLFDRVNKFVVDARESGGVVLVHCRAGQSRSATLLIAHLMLYRGWSLRRAFAHVKKRRPVVKPNDGFFAKLQQLELQMNGNEGNTMELHDINATYVNKKLAMSREDGASPRTRRAAEAAARRRSSRFATRNAEKAKETKPGLPDVVVVVDPDVAPYGLRRDGAPAASSFQRSRTT
eukprot:g4388.t1